MARTTIKSSNLSAEFTGLTDLGTGNAFAIDFSTASTYKAVANADATLTLSNAKQGQAVDVIISGDHTITFSETGSTFNKIGGVDYDGSATNLIQIACTDETAGAKVYHYMVGTYVSDTTANSN